MEGEMTQVTKKFLENYKSDRYLFRIFNSTRVGICAANGILRDEESTPYAISCNCGHHSYHPVVNNGSKVVWDPEFLVKEKNKTFIQRMIKDMWIKQL